MDIKRRIVATVMLLMAVGSGSALAEGTGCERPVSPMVPEGTTLTEDQLAKTGVVVRGFIAASQAYLQCLDDKAATYGEEITDSQRALIDVIYNSGVSEMQAAAAAYNAAVQAWRTQHDS